MSKKQEIYNNIKEKIFQEKYLPGERLASEIKLANEYNVSVFTIRGALNDLMIEGLIKKRPGSGSYIRENIVKKTNILLPIYNYFLETDSISISYTIEKLKELCLEKNYNLKLTYINKMDSVEKDLNVSGILNCITRTTYSYWTRNNIPAVSILNTVGEDYPSVVFCYRTFYRYIYNLIEKYDFKNIVFFGFDFFGGENSLETFTHFGFYEYLKQKYKAKMCYIKLKDTNIKKRLIKFFNNLNYTPDLIIFSDDIIFKSFREIYDENKFRGVKIITGANTQENYNVDFDFCKLEFDLDKRAKSALNLLEKLINREFVGQTNIFIKPKIVNEEALK